MRITLKNIRKMFGNKVILRDISLTVEPGQFVALLGPSGCGKTTLLNLMAGLTDLDGGSIYAGDTLWSKPGFTLPPEKRRIGMVFQDFALWPHMSVFDNIAFGLKLQGLRSSDIKSRVRAALELIQMGQYENAFLHQLSGGQKQRVAIARAFAPQPTVMLMDEPLSSLDAKLREQMRWEILSLVRKTGITTIYVTHDQVEALSMADHVVLMNNGYIEQSGSPTQLYREPITSFVATFVGASNLISGQAVATDGLTVTVRTSPGLTIRCAGKALTGQTVSAMIRPSDIQLQLSGDGLSQDGSRFHGNVLQRAFHGWHWQYRIRVESLSDPIEVWNTAEIPLGAEVDIVLPVAACRLVQSTHEKTVSA